MTDILLSLIDPDPEQPRKRFDPAELADLAASIQANGLAVPILVRPAGERFIIVHGERRWRAVQSLGWTTIPAEIRDLSPDDARWLALAENVQRADLSPIEEAREYERRLSEGLTQEQLAARIGKGRSYIAQKLRLLTLPAPLVYFIDLKRISEGHARQLLRLKNLYPDDLTRSFSGWRSTTDDLNLAAADRVYAWSLLRDIRPEDNPIWWFQALLTDEKGPPPDWLGNGGNLFLDTVRAHDYAVPQWIVAAFWWACFAIDLDLSVNHLQSVLSGWQERFYSAVQYMMFHGNEKPKDPNASRYARVDWLEWWGYYGDLRHTGALDWARTKPDDDTEPGRKKRLEIIEHVLRQESYALPSMLQPWGSQHAEYKQARAEIDGLYTL